MELEQSIPTPPEGFWEPTDIDVEFEQGFPPDEVKVITTIESSSEAGTTIRYCDSPLGYIYLFEVDESKIHRPGANKYDRMSRSYDIHKAIGLNVPAHAFLSDWKDKEFSNGWERISMGENDSTDITHWIATRAIRQTPEPADSRLTGIKNREVVDFREFEENLLKLAFTANHDITTANTVIDEEGTPYFVDTGAFRDMNRRMYSTRQCISQMLWVGGDIKGEDINKTGVELFEARLVSLAYHYPERIEKTVPKNFSGDKTEFHKYQDTTSFKRNIEYYRSMLPLTRVGVNPFEFDIWDITYSEYLDETSDNVQSSRLNQPP